MALIEPDDPRTATIVTRSDRAEGAGSVAASGFRARLEGLSLFDLVQMECLARARRVVRVASSGRVGYLFFENGEIFHATTKSLVGEKAALEMLEWTDGTFEPCNIAWPEKGTVKMGWQNLLLGAATSKDEQSAGKLVHLPTSRRRESPVASQGEHGGYAGEEDVMSEVEELTAAPEEERVKSASERPGSNGGGRAVRIDATGRVLSSSGDTCELAGFAAYAARVGELIGQSLGLGSFVALDMGFEASRAVLCVEEGGKVVVIEAKHPEDLAEVARGAGL